MKRAAAPPKVQEKLFTGQPANHRHAFLQCVARLRTRFKIDGTVEFERCEGRSIFLAFVESLTCTPQLVP